MNLVFVISDTLRRDHLGCYGNRWVKTPNLDRFASDAVVFDQAYEASFPTMPTRADYATGKLTCTYLGWNPLPADEPSLASMLLGAGYTTMGVVDTPFYVRQGMGYDRGFTDMLVVRGQGYEREDHNRTRATELEFCAPRTFYEAEQWLVRNRDSKFFLMVDTWDPHEPWDPPAHYVAPYLKDWDGRTVDPVYGKYKGRVSEPDLKVARACYAGEISMVDFWFGRLMQRLEQLELLDNTAVVFVADHGFYFGEHGFFGKGDRDGNRWNKSPLYDEVIRVPLLVRVPGVKPRRVATPVCQPDLMPTFLELAGLRPPDGTYGKSIVPLLKGRGKPLRDVVISSWPLHSPGDETAVVDWLTRDVGTFFASTISDGEWTLIFTANGEPVELYNTGNDPQQKRNVYKQNPEKAQQLHASFVAELEAAGCPEAALAPRRKL